MSSPQGGFLNMHVDFNWHHKLQLWRRLNAIVYLTPNWQEQWGGDLILQKEGDSTVTKVQPVFNRAVIFNVDDKCFHGQPEPLKCPNNISRNLFSSFYYSRMKSKDTSSDPHFTKYSVENSKFATDLKL